VETGALLLDFVGGGGKVLDFVTRDCVGLGLANFDDEVPGSPPRSEEKLGFAAGGGKESPWRRLEERTGGLDDKLHGWGTG
jgi:hypothetical protein